MAGTPIKYTGEASAIKIKGASTSDTVAKMNSWKVGVKVNLVDTTSFDDEGWESNEATTKAWEGSIEGVLKKDDTTGQKALLSAMANGTSVELELFTNSADTTADFTGKARIESVDIDTGVKDAIKLSIKFKGTGKLTILGV